MKYTSPKFNLSAFNCPHCSAYAQMNWGNLFLPGNRDHEAGYSWTEYFIAKCQCCSKNSFWRKEETQNAGKMGSSLF